MAMQFLVQGATRFGEAGVFMSFEETSGELVTNMASLGVDLPALQAEGRLLLDEILIERSEIEETGEYDLDGLFIRLQYAIDKVGAKRVVIDTIEALFSSFSNDAILRAEIRRLFRWLKDKGMTAIITGERTDAHLTRHGLEEFVSDCVIVLDHRIVDQISTRRLRVVKYRGTAHGTNEYPFLIDESGITVLPITSLGLEHAVTSERISSGIPDLDEMLGSQGYYRGSTILVSGPAGTGKTSVAGHFARAACMRGERCLFFSFEESAAQIRRNMATIGLDLDPWVGADQLRFFAVRPTIYGLETHLTTMHQVLDEFKPQVVVIDPITSLMVMGARLEVIAMLTRLIDFLKVEGITTLMTSLLSGHEDQDPGHLTISSLVDAWVQLRTLECEDRRQRALYVLKARGIAHSDRIRWLTVSEQGIRLRGEPWRGEADRRD